MTLADIKGVLQYRKFMAIDFTFGEKLLPSKFGNSSVL